MRTVKALMWAKTAPVEISLARGELPDLSEYPLRVQYTDGSEELRTLGYFDNFGLKPFREGKQTAIYRLGNYEISFPVFYREQKLSRVESLRFGKTEYLEGELIDNNDFLARASYSDGSEKTVCLQCKAKASPNMDSVQMRYGTCKVQIPIKVGKKVPGLQTNGKETAIQSQIQPACLARIAAISIHRPPRKRKYLLGKVISDLRGGVLDVIYDTGDVHQVPMTNDMRAEPQSLDIGETEIDIFAFGCVTSYEITILEPRAVRVMVEAMPTKREYKDGDLLDLSGLVLSVLYNDGSSEKETGLNVKRDLKKGDESVRLNYMGIPFEVPVHVKRRHHEVYPVSLVMSELPNKRVYARGEKRLVPDGGVLLLQMSDGMRKVIPLSETKIDGFATSKPGELPLIAEVQGFRCEFTLAVEEKKLVSISVSGNAKKQYYPGEAYSLTGILVFAEYDNGEREPVSDYSIDKKTAAIGDTEINFQYKGKTAVLTSFIQNVFVTDGHNPHAHILLTMRPLNEDGTWQYKTEKEYLCVRNGEERGFTAGEFKSAQAEGWEKQYQYKVGKKKTYMTPSAAEAQGLERVSKHPKATCYGRQNPITARWNSTEQIVAWRAAWADAVNRALERKGVEARVDHRSHAERGIDEKPTIHEGASARRMEQMGFVADRCEMNREIRADNALIRELKALIAKLMRAVRITLAEIARAMEQARQDIIVLTYGLFHNRKGREKDVTGEYQERYGVADAALTRKINHAKAKYDHLREQAAEYDRDELADARLALRQEMESAAHDRIERNIKGGKVSIRDYWSSISDADALLGETGMAERRMEQRRREERERRQRKAKECDAER